MRNTLRGMSFIVLLGIAAMLISSCTQSLSAAPIATSTSIPEGLFVSPFPSVENPMAMIEEFANQTAAAQTATAGGGTPGTPIDITTGTPGTPEANITTTPAAITETLVNNNTPTNVGEPGSSAAVVTSVPPGVRPATYTLQKGEWPWCIARRFDVNPNELLRLSGLTTQQAYSLVAGTVLTIPQSGSFPPPRHLLPHPATYTVASSSETLYGIACKYGDVDPNAIAAANGISVNATLTVGQQLQIP